MRRVKVVILAGGQGTRLAEETEIRPKPMVEIGGSTDPLAHHEALRRCTDFTEFVVALGYKGEDIKRYFLDYVSLSGDLTVRIGGRGGRPPRHRAR